MKKKLNIILLIVLLTFLLVWFKYINVENSKLKNYNIWEKLVITFTSEKSNKYIFNLNSWKYDIYDWIYKIINEYTIDDAISWKKVYNNTKKYFIDWDWILYQSNWKQVYLSDTIYWKAWSTDWNYLFSKEKLITRMFWLFFKKRLWNYWLTLIEAKTWKNKQFIFYNKNWKIMSVEKILWYVE